jgi:hypothetical protein
MDHLCAECQAIYRELLEASRSVQGRPRDENRSPPALGTWLEQLKEEECARMRDTSKLWATWRRMHQYRALTGHYRDAKDEQMSRRFFGREDSTVLAYPSRSSATLPRPLH